MIGRVIARGLLGFAPASWVGQHLAVLLIASPSPTGTAPPDHTVLVAVLSAGSSLGVGLLGIAGIFINRAITNGQAARQATAEHEGRIRAEQELADWKRSHPDGSEPADDQ